MSRPGFRSVVRTRVLERIAQACAYPVALIVAPPGYGKSVALRQYLETLSERYVRFDVRPEHATLPAFIRAFAESLSDVAPHMAASLPDALRGAPSADELAAWFNAQLSGYRGLIVVDDLQFASASEVAPFLRSAIDVTKDRIRWLIATRSVPDLPIASWITYGDMDLAVDERDLAFSIEEARDASADTGAHDDDLRRFVEMTGGWATALNFAFRMRVRTSELAAIGSTTRDMVYRYLAEQVYDRLSDRERELLHFAAYLPEIDVDLLIKAGFPEALATLEWLRLSAAFLSIHGKRRYRCHDLFREFLQHRVHLLGDDAAQQLQHRVAKLLLSSDWIAEALYLYIRLQAVNEIVSALSIHGFDLADKGRGDVLDAAIDALSAQDVAYDPIVVAIRAIRESDRGRFDSAETLFQHAMKRSPDPIFRAQVAVRYASDLLVQGRSVKDLLEPLVEDSLPQRIQAVAASLLSLTYAREHQVENAERAINLTTHFARVESSDALRAKLYSRIGTAQIFLNRPPAEATPFIDKAKELALKEGLYATATSAFCASASIALYWDDDRSKFERYIEEAIQVAERSGNRFSIQVALSHALDLQCRLGNTSAIAALMPRLRAVATTDRNRQKPLAYAEALIAALEGDFERAYRSSPRDFIAFYNFEQVACRSKWSLYAIAVNARDEAVALAEQNLEEIDSGDFGHPYGWRTAEMSRLLCAAVEALAGRTTVARRILRSRPLRADAEVAVLRCVVTEIVNTATSGNGPSAALQSLCGLREAGHTGLALILEGVIARLIPDSPEPPITDAERAVLRALDRGQTPKEIAGATGRSVHTVRTLIQRATEKLGCSGRQQAIAEARRRGLLESQTAGRSSVPA